MQERREVEERKMAERGKDKAGQRLRQGRDRVEIGLKQSRPGRVETWFK